MHFYKNTELANEFNIAYTTVTRWIESAKSGKNQLQLVEKNHRSYVAKTEHNRSVIQQLKIHGFGYKPKSNLKIIKPKKELYSTFTENQIVEIINTLETKKEIPLKFSYIGKGAKIWNNFIKAEENDGSYSINNTYTSLINGSIKYLDFYTSSFDKVNIIEFGAATMSLSSNIIRHLHTTGKLGKYVAIDISSELLDVTKDTIESLFPDLNYELHQSDIENTDLSSILFKDRSNESQNVINLVVFIDFYSNLDYRRKTLDNIRVGFGHDDLMLFTAPLDTATKRVALGFLDGLYDSFVWLPDLLNIDVARKDFYAEYNATKKRREAGFVLDKDYILELEALNTKRKIFFQKGEKLNVWGSYIFTRKQMLEDLDMSDFELANLSTYRNTGSMVVICGAKNSDLDLGI